MHLHNHITAHVYMLYNNKLQHIMQHPSDAMGNWHAEKSDKKMPVSKAPGNNINYINTAEKLKTASVSLLSFSLKLKVRAGSGLPWTSPELSCYKLRLTHQALISSMMSSTISACCWICSLTCFWCALIWLTNTPQICILQYPLLPCLQTVWLSLCWQLKAVHQRVRFCMRFLQAMQLNKNAINTL